MIKQNTDTIKLIQKIPKERIITLGMTEFEATNFFQKNKLTVFYEDIIKKTIIEVDDLKNFIIGYEAYEYFYFLAGEFLISIRVIYESEIREDISEDEIEVRDELEECFDIDPFWESD